MSPIIIDAIVRSSLVLACGLGAAWLLARQPAAMRHWILAAALALGGAQPLLARVVPAWQILTWQSPAVDAPPVAPGGVTTEMAFDLPSAESAVARADAPDWAGIALWIWAAGVAVSLAVLVFGALWLTWLGSRGVPASGLWPALATALSARLGLHRPVKIVVTRHPALLVTWGVAAPVILLPEGANAWEGDRVRLVLAHEMAHLKRGDWLIQVLAETARAINWFNPLFWLACARMRRESEHACDDIVLDLGIGGTSYASHLVDLARTFSTHGRTWLPAPSIARPSTLERRVRAMLNPQVNRRPVSKVRRAALAVLLIAIAIPIAAASQAPGTPSGTISDPSGRPLADAVVRLTAIGSDSVFETRTDANGAFQLGDVPAGDYLLSARSPGFSAQRQRVRLSGAYTFSLRLEVGTLRETVSVRSDGSATGAGQRSETRAPSYTPPACAAGATGGQLTPPRKLRDVRPRYKQAWVANQLEGDVLMRASIGLDGRVKNVDVISPVNVELEDEAIAAVSYWEFSPTYLNCEPVEVQMYVTVSFKIER
jgi:TonB family protein